jgi:hypothetical protein
LKCELLLIDKLSVENAIELFLLAFRHSRTQLKEAAMKFISKNVSMVKETQDWRDLKKNPASTEPLLEMVEFLSTK